MATHHITRRQFHYKWNKDHTPAATISPGDTVRFDANDVLSWQLTAKSKSSDLNKLDTEKLYPLAGPVYVKGAEPGDALVLDILGVKVNDFGWTAILPGLGLLDEFKDPFLYKWALKDKRFARFEKGIRIPIRPFCGVLGVAPAKAGSFDVMPPGKHGGNMDIRHTTAGSRVRLPVQVEGALFSTGDIHAAMGDGEICVCAIECAGSVSIRFGLEKGAGLSFPEFYTRGETPPRKGSLNSSSRPRPGRIAVQPKSSTFTSRMSRISASPGSAPFTYTGPASG